jgi:hypothetical protein
MTAPAIATVTILAHELQGLQEAHIEGLAHIEDEVLGLRAWYDRLAVATPADFEALCRDARNALRERFQRNRAARAEVLRLTTPEPRQRFTFGGAERVRPGVVGGSVR